jgi:DNA-directed RNA polymerase subunit RPC12/RpoP
MTATPVGPGGIRIAHFDAIVEPIKNSEVIDAGHLLRVHPYLAPSEPDLGGIDLKRASQDEIGERVQVCTVYGDVFKEWEPYKHMQTMVVLPTRAVCNGFLQECLRRGLTAKVVDGTTRQDERDGTFSEFKATDCQMLLGVDVIREGLDLPIAQCLIDLQPTHQFRVFWQKLGRVKRPHDGQDTAIVIDLAGNLDRFMIHPDHDPPWDELTEDNTIEEVIEKKAGVRCPECGSKDIYSIKGHGYKCEDCGHTWVTNKPWVCPKCKQALSPWQKMIDGTCPNCGAKVGSKPVRRIRMEDGSIREWPADEVIRRKKCKADSEQAEWLRWIFIARGWNRKNPGKPPKTLGWCRAMFQKTQGKWPRAGMKYMPSGSANDGDWKRAPEAVFPWLDKQRA